MLCLRTFPMHWQHYLMVGVIYDVIIGLYKYS